MMADEEMFNYITASLSVVLSITTILLNIFCIDVIRRSKLLLRKPSTVFIVNLLVLQLIQGLFVLPLYIAQQANFQDDHWKIRICNGFRFSYTITFFGTCLGILLTSIDRFFAVYWIASYRFRLTRPRVMTILLMKWMYVVILCSLPLFNTSPHENDIVLSCQSYAIEVACDYHPSKLWSIIMLLVNTALPYIIIVAVYIYVIRTVKFFEKRAHQKPSKYFEVPLRNQGGVIKLKKKDIAKHKKITKLAIILCLVYAFLWMPSVAYYAVTHVCPDCFQAFSCRSDYVKFFITFVAFLNGIAVPVVYCFYQKDFRRSAGYRPSVKNSISKDVLGVSDIEKVKLLSEDVL